VNDWTSNIPSEELAQLVALWSMPGPLDLWRAQLCDWCEEHGIDPKAPKAVFVAGAAQALRERGWVDLGRPPE
jgi:hypothetical protein